MIWKLVAMVFIEYSKSLLIYQMPCNIYTDHSGLKYIFT